MRPILNSSTYLLRAFCVLVPVRDLNTDEYADNDNEEIQPDREPILILDVFGEATQDHGSSSGSGMPSSLYPLRRHNESKGLAASMR